MTYAEDAKGKMEDATAQIARLREQVEALMKDRVTPAVAEAAGRAESAHVRRGGRGARSGRGGVRPGARAAAAGDPDRRGDRLRARPGDALIDAHPPAGADCGGGGGTASARAGPADRGACCVGLIALMFLGWALAFAHVAAWFWLRRVGWAELGAALRMAGARPGHCGGAHGLWRRGHHLDGWRWRRWQCASAHGTAPPGARVSALVVQVVRLVAELVRRRRV